MFIVLLCRGILVAYHKLPFLLLSKIDNGHRGQELALTVFMFRVRIRVVNASLPR